MVDLCEGQWIFWIHLIKTATCFCVFIFSVKVKDHGSFTLSVINAGIELDFTLGLCQFVRICNVCKV